MAPTTIWVVLLTVPALPDDRAAFLADVPEQALVMFADGPGEAPRTGIGMRVGKPTAIGAIQLGLRVLFDLQVNLGHVAPTSVQAYTETEFRELILDNGDRDDTDFSRLLLGATDCAVEALADRDLPSVFEDR